MKRTGEWVTDWFDDDYLLLYAWHDEAEARRNTEILISLAPHEKQLRILDVACGTGRYTCSAASFGHSAIGIDSSAFLLSRCHYLEDVSGLKRPSYIRGDMRTLPLLTESVDVVWSLFNSFGYFESDNEHQALLKEWRRVLRNGGCLQLNYFNRDFVVANLVRNSSVERNQTRFEIARHLSHDGSRIEKVIQIEKPDADTRIVEESVRLFSADEILSLLLAAGFRCNHPNDGFSNRPATTSSAQLLFVAQAIAQ